MYVRYGCGRYFDRGGPRDVTLLSDEVDIFDGGGPGNVAELLDMVDIFKEDQKM